MNCFKEIEVKGLICAALKEDVGTIDITTQALIHGNKKARGVFLAKETCVVCGLGVVALVFKHLDKNIKFKPLLKDGDTAKKGKIIATVSGKAKSILTAERVALNFLSLLSGISTKAKNYVLAVKPYKAKIIDTRKTIPGLRLLEKYAVRLGGAFNHRMCLDEMFLIKDNHLQVIGGIEKVPELSKKFRVEIEVKNLKELELALKLKPDIIMLDNMPVKILRKAVRLRNKFSALFANPLPKLEASGGVTLKNVKSIASTGIDMISIGELTHSVRSADISLEIL